MQNPFENIFSTMFGTEIKVPDERKRELIGTAYTVVHTLEGLTKDEMTFVLVSVARAHADLLTVTSEHHKISAALDKVVGVEVRA